MLDDRQSALVELGLALLASGYRFVSPTPESHRRVLARGTGAAPGEAPTGEEPIAEARLVRDAFGWSRPFPASRLPARLRVLGDAADLFQSDAVDRALVRSRVRFSTLEGPAGCHLFVHSAYPTTSADAVFFGPDSYRFAAAIRRTVKPARRLVDVGCGTGVGGLVLADRVSQIVLADISPRALDFAAVNRAIAARAGGCAEDRVALCQSDVLASVGGDLDAVIANPPYLIGPDGERGRLYRDGGGELGTGLASRIVTESLARLARGRGGQLVLYTGVPIVDGRNVLQDRLDAPLRAAGARWRWEELDPDVFGEELSRPCYHQTERLAAVLLTAELG